MNKIAASPHETLSTKEVASFLSIELGGSASNWSTWLANERKPNRVSRRLSPIPGSGRPCYSDDTVRAFVSECKQEKLMAGKSGIRTGSPKGANFTPHISALTLSEGAEEAAVLFVIAKPLASFLLSAAEARTIAAKLTQAADEIEREANYQ